MQDLWDEEYTDLCRENFINAMYKFPDTPVNELENGREMPILGVGTWLKQNVQETVEQALRAGFRCGRATLCYNLFNGSGPASVPECNFAPSHISDSCSAAYALGVLLGHARDMVSVHEG